MTMTNHFIIKKPEYEHQLVNFPENHLRDTTCLRAKDWVFDEK